MAIVRSARSRILLVVGAALALVLAGAGLVAAVGPTGSPHDAALRRAGDAARTQGTTRDGLCRMAYDTGTALLTPPDDSTRDNHPAASVEMKKMCQGAVVGSFTSEVLVPDASNFIHIDLRATCVAPGGVLNPCPVGQEVFAAPGHSFFQDGPAAPHTGTVTMVWPSLARGTWRFDVLAGGDARSSLQFRTFVVHAFDGG